MKRVLLPLAVATALGSLALVNLTLADKPAYVYKGQWGGKGTGDGQFEGPGFAAVGPTGIVYCADSRNHRIQYFTSTGSFLGKWGSRGAGNGQFNWPGTIAVGPDGNIYIADMENYRIQYFTPSGSFLGKWGSKGDGPGRFQTNIRLAVSRTSGRVYVTDQHWNLPTGPLTTRVQIFSKTGGYLGQWIPPLESGDTCMCLGPDDTIYLTSRDPISAKGAVTYYTATGSSLGAWGSAGDGPGRFHAPQDIKYSPAANLVFIGDSKTGRIQVFTPTGTYITEWGSRGSGDGQFKWAAGIAVSPASPTVYVCDPENNRIQYFAPGNPPSTGCACCRSFGQ